MKFLFFILSFFIYTYAHCQFTGFGVGGGGAVSNFEYGSQTQDVMQFDSENKGGGTGGIRFDFDLGNEYIKLSPEFFVVQNGSKEFYQDFTVLQDDLINRRVSLDYIGLYVPLTVYVPIENGSGITDYFYNGILIQGRVFADYAINAQIDEGVLGTKDIQFASEEDKFDYGYSFEAGFVAQGIKFMFGYNWGIKNIEFSNALGDVDSENYLINNRGFTIQLGYIYKINGAGGNGY